MEIIHILYLKLTELKSKLFRSHIARKTAVEYKDRSDAKFDPPFIMTVSSQFTVLKGVPSASTISYSSFPREDSMWYLKIRVRHLALTPPSLRNPQMTSRFTLGELSVGKAFRELGTNAVTSRGQNRHWGVYELGNPRVDSLDDYLCYKHKFKGQASLMLSYFLDNREKIARC